MGDIITSNDGEIRRVSIGANKRRFLLIEVSDYSKEMWMLIPTDSIEAIEWVNGGAVTIYYRIDDELHNVDVKQSFFDISNGKCTVEL